MKKSTNDLLVSIIIPVFNGEKYLSETIESALTQTYRNCEVIVVNDGSTDGTEVIVRSYGNQVRYIKKTNGGVSTALNLGIQEAKGEYISWLSHDDVYVPNKIALQVDRLNQVPAPLRSSAIVMSNLQVIDDQSHVIDRWAIHKVHDVKKFSCPLYPVMKGLVHGCTLLIPKQLIIDAGYFNEDLKTSQDYDMWFKIFPKARVLFVQDYLVKMRRHKDQGTNSNVALDESNAIWIKMIQNISDADKILIDGSVRHFYARMHELMGRVGYYEAASFAEHRLHSL